jgi:sugar phosphate permease
LCLVKNYWDDRNGPVEWVVLIFVQVTLCGYQVLLGLYSCELFPTSVRGTVHGLTVGIGMFFYLFPTYVVPLLELEEFGIKHLNGSSIIGIFVPWWLLVMPETANKRMD